MSEDAGLVTLPQSGQFPKVKLIQPTGHGYVIAAFEIDHRPPIGFAFESRAKREAIAALKRLAAELRDEAGVIEATVFKTLLQPPGRGALLAARPQVPVARFDLVLLVETASVAEAEALAASARLGEALAPVRAAAKRTPYAPPFRRPVAASYRGESARGDAFCLPALCSRLSSAVSHSMS